jgi:hypothetical protein
MGTDNRGLLLEVIALDLPAVIVVIHVMPVYRERRTSRGTQE